MNAGEPALLRARRPALLACAVLGVVGAALGVVLTVLKFRATYTPCLASSGGCRIGEMRCDDALGTSWSVVAGLPISAWASAAYLCVVVLALGQLVRRGFLGGCSAALLRLLALAVTLVSLGYAAYAFVTLDSPCPYCLSLYVVGVLLLGAAELAWRSADPRQQFGLRVAFGHRRASFVDAVFRVAMSMTIATGAQSVAYHGLRNTVSAQDGCPEPAEPSPAATIRAGAKDPRVILAVYLDMSCSACKRKFKQLAAALRGDRFPAPVQLWIFHVPRHACDPAAFPAGFALGDDRARDDNGCLAARAVECAEKLQPGAGFRLIGGLFALHEDRRPGQPLFDAERVADRAVDLGLEIDPDDRDNSLYRCIDDDRGVLATITSHQRHAERLNLTVPTIAVHAAADGAIDPRRKALWLVADAPIDSLARYVEMQAAPPVPSE